MVKRKCIRGGANYWLNKSRIWLPWNKSLTGGRLFGVSFYKGKFKDWTKRGGTLRRRVYNKMKRGKGYTRADLIGITADGRQIY